MKRTPIKETPLAVGDVVCVEGWVDVRRDHGKIVFLDVRDAGAVCQVVCGPWSPKETYQTAQEARAEWVVRVEGLVKNRPKELVNEKLLTGTIELDAQRIEILNQAHTLPFSIADEGYAVNEEVRMRYRYVDLRRPRLARNIALRHAVTKYIRDYLDERGFYEIETPILTKSTPEGARDYIVPSRLYPGQWYALPQSPQQYKQLLMVGGVEKYFQIARCFRDEDTRGDRQPEFTQMDLEMAFVGREEVMALNEAMLIALVKTLFPEKKVQDIPFPRLTYQEAMEKYGTDRPDLRKDKNDKNVLAFAWIVDFPFFEKTEGGYTFTHNPFSAPINDHLPWLMEKTRVDEILTTQYDVALNGFEIGGGSIRNHRPEALKKVFEIMGFSDERIQKNFGHMLEALSLGTPPHGGIAWGLDRLLALLLDEPNIREVIAFPKTGDARDVMMDAPSAVEDIQLKELRISINQDKKQK